MKKALLLLSLLLCSLPADEFGFVSESITADNAANFKEWVPLIRFFKAPETSPAFGSIGIEIRLKPAIPGVNSWKSNLRIKDEFASVFFLNISENKVTGETSVLSLISPALREKAWIYLDFVDNTPGQSMYKTYLIKLTDFPVE